MIAREIDIESDDVRFRFVRADVLTDMAYEILTTAERAIQRAFHYRA